MILRGGKGSLGSSLGGGEGGCNAKIVCSFIKTKRT